MAKKADRGTKRTCQNSSCGARFYDLSRDPITCPICGSVYALAVSAPAGGEERAARRAPKKPDQIVPTPGKAPEVEGEEALVDAEGEEPIAAEDDETFLEEEEDEGGDVSGIIGGPVGEDGEEP
jgi:hypothetical protein